MNILKRELRAGVKPFLLWTIALFVLVFAGMIKYTGIEAGGATVGEIIEQFPRIVQAFLGIVGINIETLGGYYAVLAYFALLCGAVYAVYLGGNAVSREASDKTYEFVFTKPRTRSYILSIKLAAAFIYLLLFCVLDYLFSIAATASLGLDENINGEMALFALSLFFIMLLFFTLSAFLSAVSKRAEKGSFYANICLSFAFVMGIVFDMLENGGLLRLLSPLKYFAAADLLASNFDAVYAIICAALSAILLYAAFHSFEKRDLSAA